MAAVLKHFILMMLPMEVQREMTSSTNNEVANTLVVLMDKTFCIYTELYHCKCLCYFVVDFMICSMIHNQICEHNITCRHDDFGHTHKSGVKEELGLLMVDKGTVFELSLFKSSFVPKNWLRSPSQPFLYMIILFCQLNSFPKRQGFTYSSRILTLITKYSLSCHLSKYNPLLLSGLGHYCGHRHKN